MSTCNRLDIESLGSGLTMPPTFENVMPTSLELFDSSIFSQHCTDDCVAINSLGSAAEIYTNLPL